MPAPGSQLDGGKCAHGYWTHAAVPCPWCHGFTAETADVVSVRGPGNGWLLRATDSPCIGCGGPGGAGFGLLPEGVTHEWWSEAIVPRLNLCYECGSSRPELGARAFRWRDVPIPPGVRAEAARRAEASERAAEARRAAAAGEPYRERF